MDFIEFDGNYPITLFNDDRYFFSASELSVWIDVNEFTEEEARNLLWMSCSPIKLSQIDADVLLDDQHEDAELPEEISVKLDELNQLISKVKPFTWTQGKYALSASSVMGEVNFVFQEEASGKGEVSS